MRPPRAHHAHGDGSRSGETISGGLLDGVALISPLDSSGRPAGFVASADNGVASLANFGYTYDAVSRLSTVSGLSMSASYNYVAGSPELIDKITLTDGNNGPALSGDRSYDGFDRLKSINYDQGGTSITSHTYTLNSLHQRTRADLEDGGYRTYAYNDRGEVESAQRFLPGGTTPLAGFQQSFGYDNIGNRSNSAEGGDETGANLAATAYTADALNQYSQIDYPEIHRVTGKARTDATVTVNTQSPTRQGEHWSIAFAAGNQSGPSAESVDVVATRSGVGVGGGDVTTTRSGQVLMPAKVTAPSHDLDGNLLNDGLRDYTWNGENRLIALQTSVAAVTAGAANRRWTFAYDAEGRRVAMAESTWDDANSEWLPLDYRRFVYDGWNLVAEIDGNDQRMRGFVWGTDLSGSMQGAGGVGGLLAVVDDVSETTPAGEVYFPGYDGNGNVTAMIAGSTGLEAARFEYSAFGRLLRAEGRAKEVNPFLFSTKYRDSSGLVYYGFRYYTPETGRWLSRDPIEERGGINLYALVRNAAVNVVDYLGLRDLSSEEHQVVKELMNQSANIKSKNKSLSDELKATATDFKELINEIPGDSPPKRIAFLNAGFEIWLKPQKALNYNVTKAGAFMCSAFVKRSLFVGGITGYGEPNASVFTNGPNQIGTATLKVIYKLESASGESVPIDGHNIAGFESTFEIRKPKMGDIIASRTEFSFPNTSHVGIYLNHGIFLSAIMTTEPTAVGPQLPIDPDKHRFQPEGSVMIKFIPDNIEPQKKIIFRSVD